MNASTYYNDNAPYIVDWLFRLQQADLIGRGFIDPRQVQHVLPRDVRPFTRAHFFAGIAGWELALQIAGWPAGLPVWTGSCPCQPFSVAGKRQGVADERHLWPYWRSLIEECKPPVSFGEQVASPGGRKWLTGVFADLEARGYAVAGADLCAAGVGAPHIRQRLYWVADAAMSDRWRGEWKAQEGVGPDAKWRQRSSSSGTDGFIRCTDGKARRIEPGISPLVDGVPARMGKLRAYGNAIVPQVAAQFIRAFLTIRN